jgi:hypothetical protein
VKKVAGEPDYNVAVENNNIAWTSDIDYKFKNIINVPAGRGPNWQDVQWYDMTNRK